MAAVCIDTELRHNTVYALNKQIQTKEIYSQIYCVFSQIGFQPYMYSLGGNHYVPYVVIAPQKQNGGNTQ